MSKKGILLLISFLAVWCAVLTIAEWSLRPVPEAEVKEKKMTVYSVELARDPVIEIPTTETEAPTEPVTEIPETTAAADPIEPTLAPETDPLVETYAPEPVIESYEPIIEIPETAYAPPPTSGRIPLGSFLITGYTAEAGFPEGQATHSGYPVGPGVCAMNYWQRITLGIEWGEQLEIVGLGTFTVYDSGCPYGVVDVWVPTNAEAYAMTAYYDVYLLR